MTAPSCRARTCAAGACWSTPPACSDSLAGERLLGPAVERVRTGGIAATRACAERGLGIALLPECAVREELASGSLVRLPPPTPDGEAGFRLRLRVVWRADREAVPGLREMLHAVAAWKAVLTPLVARPRCG
jgi:DNA-binding transcriptional LysR family regulator